KSWACPAAPLASAAHVGDVRSEAPTTVQSGVPPSARATSRTIRAIGSVLPASMTPIESSAARRTLAMASRGQSSRRVLTTNSAIRAMALMAVDYSPELSPLASPPSCLRHTSAMSRRRLTALSAVHLALPRGVSAPLASPPSCLRHSSIMSRLRLTAPSAVHLALPRGVSARTIFDHFTVRLAALVPAALLDHVTAAAHRAERGSPRTATGRLGSHDFRSFHRSPRRPRACGNSGASRLARHYFASWKITPSV